MTGTNTILAAFLDIARDAGAEVVAPIAALGLPSGPVHRDAYEHMSEAILTAVGGGCDALFLDLHGAMVSESSDDGEGTLLERIRAVAPDLPIAVGLDLHANMNDATVGNCTAIFGYKTYPHIDMYNTGARVGSILLRAIRGEIRPAMAWGNRPMLPQTLRMGTDTSPMKDLIDMTLEAKAQGALAASVFGGFPLADMHEAGLSVVVLTDNDPEAVGQMIAAGVGAQITLQIGGKRDMPAIGLVGAPLEVTGTVRTISDGEFTIRGPVYTGMRARMGRSVALDTGPVQIVVTERQFEPWDLGAFRSVGIEPTQKRFPVLKSRIHYRGAFLPIARGVIECDGIGVTSSDYSQFPFKKLRRPIYPLDPDAEA